MAARFDIISFDYIKKIFEKHYKVIFMMGGCCAAAGAGLYFFAQRNIQLQERAYVAFTQTMTEIMHAKKDATLWSNAELAAKTGYRDYKNSSLAPYFLVLASQALSFQAHDKESLEFMEKASKNISKSSPFYYIFKIKAARMKLDSDDIGVQKEGFDSLRSLAHDSANKQRDEALYYLGDYYISQNDRAHAQETLNELVTTYRETSDVAASPWVTLALEKLKE